MRIQFRDEPLLTLHGYSPQAPRRIIERVLAGARPSALPGDFVLVAEGTDASSGQALTVFVSTAVAAIPHFYARGAAGWVHATNVFDCCRAAGLDWRWDWDSLAQLTLFEHVLGNASLHPSIHRVPPASVVRLCGGEIGTESEPFWQALDGGVPRTRPADAADVLVEILGELPDAGGCSLSLSAGFDSRLLLAALTHLGRRPVTACMGSRDSTDPRVARLLAETAGCDFRRVEIEPADYVTHAPDIVTLTSGEKIFWHWHTGIYSRKVGFDPRAIHLAGSNGEFARSYFFDKGIVALLADAIGIGRWDRWLSLKNSCARRVSPAIRAALGPDSDFAAALDADHQLERAFVRTRSFGAGLDYFYAAERVRNFIGLGLALYRASFPTMSPFLDARFIRCAAGLSRRDKLADHTHRAAIGRLGPRLLEFPTDDSGRPMSAAPQPLYYLRPRPSSAYQRHREAQRQPEVAAWARDGFRVLAARDDLVPGSSLDAEVTRWNHAITVGATLRKLAGLGLRVT